MSELLNHWPILAMIALIIFGILSAIFFSNGGKMPYAKRESLVTNSELRFYRVLVDAVEDDWLVFSKVRIADLLAVKSGTKKRMSWQNRINQKHVDFVICNPETLIPMVAIELDDRSHDRPERQARDRFVNAAFSAATMPLLRIPTAKSYNSKHIRNQIETLKRKRSA